MKNFNVQNIRKDFKYINEGYIYLDTAATSQKPKCIVDKLAEYYLKYTGNPHSENMHHFSFIGTKILEDGKKKVAEFIGSKKEEIVFTKSATESLNAAIFGLKDLVKEGEILISILEHHANLVPYQIIAKENNLKLNFSYIDAKTKEFSYKDFEEKINFKTKIIGLTSCSNVTGEEIDLEKIKKIIDKKIHEFEEKAKNEDKEYIRPYIIIDLSQSINHKKINLEKLDIYAAGFSGHKMYGPEGIGVLYINKKYINKIKPLIYGGGMINEVFENKASYKDGMEKFEAGSPNVAGVYALTEAIKYLENIGMENIEEYIKELTKYARKKLEEIPEVEIYSPKTSTSLVSFNVRGIHSHDVSYILDQRKICIRAGHHCAMPLHQCLNAYSSMRASFGIYNTKNEIDELVSAIKYAIEFFK